MHTMKSNTKNRTLFIFATVILVYTLSNCYYQPQDDYSSTIIVWDNTGQTSHKLLFHTIYLNDQSLSGFSLTTLKYETFYISDENKAQFEKMKELQGVKSVEVQCSQCHISVGKLQKEENKN